MTVSIRREPWGGWMEMQGKMGMAAARCFPRGRQVASQFRMPGGNQKGGGLSRRLGASTP